MKTLAITVLYSNHQMNDSWKTLVTDARTDCKLDQYSYWKDVSGVSLPNNELGQAVSDGAYVRAAWLKAGLFLIVEIPMGYGLIEDSFDRVAKASRPDGRNLTHSGWLDLFLGIGLPDFCLLEFYL